jgi:hypothetical protein
MYQNGQSTTAAGVCMIVLAGKVVVIGKSFDQSVHVIT